MTYRQPFKGDYIITQRFGETVTDPKGHTGIDYGCPLGTEILASNDGEVIFAGGDKTGYGNLAVIRHDDGNATFYAHLSKIGVKPGQKVKQSDPIGAAGWTGNVVPNGPGGCHLHFEVRGPDGKAFDPMSLPMITMADTPKPEPAPDTERPGNELLKAGVYKVACPQAWVRTWPALVRSYIVYQGEPVYIFDDVLRDGNALPFHFIGAGRCIAEYDIDGTWILE
jgi:murein DD-endopeptidase MepM/ murein hydrolase activator NlpD